MSSAKNAFEKAADIIRDDKPEDIRDALMQELLDAYDSEEQQGDLIRELLSRKTGKKPDQCIHWLWKFYKKSEIRVEKDKFLGEIDTALTDLSSRKPEWAAILCAQMIGQTEQGSALDQHLQERFLICIKRSVMIEQGTQKATRAMQYATTDIQDERAETLRQRADRLLSRMCTPPPSGRPN